MRLYVSTQRWPGVLYALTIGGKEVHLRVGWVRCYWTLPHNRYGIIVARLVMRFGHTPRVWRRQLSV